MRVPTVVNHTEQVGPVHWVGLPPLTSGSLGGHQSTVGLHTELHPLPLVVTLPPQSGPVHQVALVAVGPGDARAVTRVRAGDGVGALGPGGGVGILTVSLTLHTSG